MNARVWKFGDGVDTDVMAPGLYMKLPITQLAAHCLEALRPEFAGGVHEGDILVAGRNFGIGSSREQAPQALKALGIRAVVAPAADTFVTLADMLQPREVADVGRAITRPARTLVAAGA